ncbi:ribose-5-phosphate isomerase RpiA [Cohnella candidum]|uniref:Ribose-5-phosphate isomerase A n=1 Tax=Cohnella candidum TaxID=2674991 RepID=A0A3G3JVK3_9BACL|nr:ribose-5-phosphate isomerase RpiA [Cohnella candidum]AYQ72273.1 ribose-5-phosphate isomerase RpiA [Cohnella candidum]
MDDKKKRAGERAAAFVQGGMVVGLGTGSTAYWAILKLGERVREGLSIRGIPTSERSKELAERLGIPLTTFAEVEKIDLTIDGADEIDPRFNLIKGGGGALFREKMAAVNSDKVVIVADDSKRVAELGKFRVPIEVVPFGWEATARRIREIGGQTSLRMAEEKPFRTDNGNWILDGDFGAIREPAELHRQLKLTTGVVETGLFPEAADIVVWATDTDVEVLARSRTE